jgi:methionyl-tRNA formyltransferase
MPKPRIVFMGTPEFAVPSLEILIRHPYPVVGVVTQPDRPRGRGKQTAHPPVKAFAEMNRLALLQPERVKDPAFMEALRTMAPDLVAVAAFGQILPKQILDLPSLGCINVHPSLLPKYRGAAPLNWTVIRGETRTGVTIMRMDDGMDSGDILLQEETPVGPGETFGQLHDRLAEMGAGLLLKAIGMIEKGTVRRTPQDHAAATFAPRLKKEDGIIDWSRGADEIVRLVRGLSPAPCAYTFLQGKTLRVFSAAGRETPVDQIPGTLSAATEEGLPVAAGDGIVFLREVQMEGRKRMPVGDFLRGCRLQPGERLG